MSSAGTHSLSAADSARQAAEEIDRAITGTTDPTAVGALTAAKADANHLRKRLERIGSYLQDEPLNAARVHRSGGQ